MEEINEEVRMGREEKNRGDRRGKQNGKRGGVEEAKGLED